MRLALARVRNGRRCACSQAFDPLALAGGVATVTSAIGGLCIVVAATGIARRSPIRLLFPGGRGRARQATPRGGRIAHSHRTHNIADLFYRVSGSRQYIHFFLFKIIGL